MSYRQDCKDQVDGYSYNDYRKFETPSEAWDYVDQNSSYGKSYTQDLKAISYKSNDNNQVALRGNYGNTTAYKRTDYVVWNKNC